jgi:hypothetical protein
MIHLLLYCLSVGFLFFWREWVFDYFEEEKKSTFLDIIGSRQWMNMIKIILSGGYVFLLLQCVEMSSTWVRKKNSTN